ncbi:hypothetical protein [Janthinobacterium sp. 17J80-10]|uniref:hypothetical protein n=1 Tax=Janthinobacterium sp. 17J80-10 TaxID=2497863 RepID=UPI001F506EC0|nr:hypothetical protein [Janthinobacterium sp. 17J80-10]
MARKTTIARGIHDNQNFAAVLAKRLWLIVLQTRESVLQQWWARNTISGDGGAGKSLCAAHQADNADDPDKRHENPRLLLGLCSGAMASMAHFYKLAEIGGAHCLHASILIPNPFISLRFFSSKTPRHFFEKAS